MGHLWRWSGVIGTVVVQDKRKMNLKGWLWGAHVQARTEIHCEPRREKHSAINTRTEHDPLHSAVIRCGDGAETFLAYSPTIYCTKHLSVWVVLPESGRVEESTATHPYTHLDLPSLNLQLMCLDIL
jgi:hypothetical protein